MRFSLRQFAIAFALLVTIASTPLSAATYQANGQYITFGGVEPTGCVAIYLFVNRTSSGTVLFYRLQDVCEPDPARQIIAQGTGTIPNTALTFESTKTRATLALTITGSSSTFTAAGLVGNINATLTRNGFSTYTFTGQTRVEFGNVLLRSHGTRSEQSATVVGEIFGYLLTTPAGTIGFTQDLLIEIVPKL